jgi:hypothetical protein
VRYEDLVADPVAQMRSLYAHLELGDFSLVQPALAAYAVRSKRYRTNEYDVSPATHRQIAQAWSRFIAQHAYGCDSRPAAPPERSLDAHLTGS